MNRIAESKTVLHIFTDIIQGREIEVNSLPCRTFEIKGLVRIPQPAGNIKEYYVEDLKVQTNSSQLILHVQLMPL